MPNYVSSTYAYCARKGPCSLRSEPLPWMLKFVVLSAVWPSFYGGRLSDATDPSMLLRRRYKVTPTLCIGAVLVGWWMPFTRQPYFDRYSISVLQEERGCGMPAKGPKLKGLLFLRLTCIVNVQCIVRCQKYADALCQIWPKNCSLP